MQELVKGRHMKRDEWLDIVRGSVKRKISECDMNEEFVESGKIIVLDKILEYCLEVGDKL